MGLSREERRALDEIEERLAFDDPELDALLARPRGTGVPGVAGSTGTSRRFAIPEGAWVLVVVLAYVVFLIGVVTLLQTGEPACPSTGGEVCERPSQGASA
ncbi:DUF3040 domain-containing protein [Nonomuraea sp. NPDC047897]|uniref:DUF3040 domain-containing protein n=1 Tax=Nonomuraea sp. NPDC047897 TaxID=3364346 RepID=UPI003716A2DC